MTPRQERSGCGAGAGMSIGARHGRRRHTRFRNPQVETPGCFAIRASGTRDRAGLRHR